MTSKERAKEKLIITGISKDFEKDKEIKKQKLQLRKRRTDTSKCYKTVQVIF